MGLYEKALGRIGRDWSRLAQAWFAVVLIAGIAFTFGFLGGRIYYQDQIDFYQKRLEGCAGAPTTVILPDRRLREPSFSFLVAGIKTLLASGAMIPCEPAIQGCSTDECEQYGRDFAAMLEGAGLRSRRSYLLDSNPDFSWPFYDGTIEVVGNRKVGELFERSMNGERTVVRARKHDDNCFNITIGPLPN